MLSKQAMFGVSLFLLFTSILHGCTGLDLRVAWLVPEGRYRETANRGTSAGALRLAYDVVSNNDQLLHGHSIRIKQFPVDCELMSIITTMVSMKRNYDPDVIIGPPCQADFKTVGVVAADSNLPVFSWYNIDSEFDNVTRYPTMVRLMPSASTLSAVLIDVLHRFNDRNIVVLFYQSEPWSIVHKAIRRQADRDGGMSFTSFPVRVGISESDVQSLLTAIKARFSILVLICPSHVIREIMLVARRLGMANGRFAFIRLDPEIHTDDLLSDNGWRKGDRFDTKAKLAYRHLIHIAYDPMYETNSPPKSTPTNRFGDFSRLIQTTKKVNNSNLKLPLGGKPDIYSMFLYDAFLTWAAVTDTLLQSHSNHRDGRLVAETIRSFKAHGATGYISFNRNMDRHAKIFILRMTKGGNFEPVKIYRTSKAGMEIVRIPPSDDKGRRLETISQPIINDSRPRDKQPHAMKSTRVEPTKSVVKVLPIPTVKQSTSNTNKVNVDVTRTDPVNKGISNNVYLTNIVPPVPIKLLVTDPALVSNTTSISVQYRDKLIAKTDLYDKHKKSRHASPATEATKHQQPSKKFKDTRKGYISKNRLNDVANTAHLRFENMDGLKPTSTIKPNTHQQSSTTPRSHTKVEATASRQEKQSPFLRDKNKRQRTHFTTIETTAHIHQSTKHDLRASFSATRKSQAGEMQNLNDGHQSNTEGITNQKQSHMIPRSKEIVKSIRKRPALLRPKNTKDLKAVTSVETTNKKHPILKPISVAKLAGSPPPSSQSRLLISSRQPSMSSPTLLPIKTTTSIRPKKPTILFIEPTITFKPYPISSTTTYVTSTTSTTPLTSATSKNISTTSSTSSSPPITKVSSIISTTPTTKNIIHSPTVTISTVSSTSSTSVPKTFHTRTSPISITTSAQYQRATQREPSYITRQRELQRLYRLQWQRMMRERYESMVNSFRDELGLPDLMSQQEMLNEYMAEHRHVYHQTTTPTTNMVQTTPVVRKVPAHRRKKTVIMRSSQLSATGPGGNYDTLVKRIASKLVNHMPPSNSNASPLTTTTWVPARNNIPTEEPWWMA